MAKIRLKFNTPREVRRSLIRVANLVINGELDPKVANSITAIANSILGSVRTDEQQKQIEELQALLEGIEEDKKR